MLENIPAEKIPELLESRDGYKSLLEHLRNIKVWVDSVYDAIPKNVIDADKGGTYNGPITFNGGVTTTDNNKLIVNGSAKFFGVTELNSGISQIANVKTDGIFGVNTVVASIRERIIPTTWDNVVEYTPIFSSNYLIYLYIRVNQPGTNLDLILEYTDAGGLQNQIILSNSVQENGSYSISPIFINAIGNHPIRIKAMTNQKDHVFISTSIVGL